MELLLPILAFGFFLGMRHATDADHVIAVSTIVSRQRNLGASALVGMLWGAGHSVTVTIVGGAVILFGIVIPPRVGLSMEFAVGIMLMLLGVLNLSGLTRWITEYLTPGGSTLHSHGHTHGGEVHEHVHAHVPDPGEELSAPPRGVAARWLSGLGLYQAVRPLVVGLVHGLAGSAAIALLLLTTIRDPLTAFLYLGIFHLGVIGGMMLITAAIGVPFVLTSGRFQGFNRFLGTASGVLSLAIGLFVIYDVTFQGGLFSDVPHWEPE